MSGRSRQRRGDGAPLRDRSAAGDALDHPDPDALADFAAQVLPDEAARAVDAHVRECPACAGLLTEAEAMRSLLRGQEPVPIPEDIVARLESALAAERLAPPAPAPAPAPPGSPTTTGSLRALTGRDAPTTRLRRMPAEPERARRQALEEQRSGPGPRAGDEDGRRWWRGGSGVPGGPLLAAAAAVVLLAAGGVAVRALGWSSDLSGQGGTSLESAADEGAGDGTAAGAAAPPLTSPVLATGTDYGEASLPAQTRALVGKAAAADAAAPAPEQAARSSAGADASDATGNQSLRSADALRACLGELGAGPSQPVAVDLARYRGRDAAIIVVQTETGAYDVWVVARDCRPGADGSLAFVTVPA